MSNHTARRFGIFSAAAVVILLIGAGCAHNQISQSPNNNKPLWLTLATQPPEKIDGTNDAAIIAQVKQHLTEIATTYPDQIVMAQISFSEPGSLADLEKLAMNSHFTPTDDITQVFLLGMLTGSAVTDGSKLSWSDYITTLAKQLGAPPSVKRELSDTVTVENSAQVTDVAVLATTKDLLDAWNKYPNIRTIFILGTANEHVQQHLIYPGVPLKQ